MLEKKNVNNTVHKKLVRELVTYGLWKDNRNISLTYIRLYSAKSYKWVTRTARNCLDYFP